MAPNGFVYNLGRGQHRAMKRQWRGNQWQTPVKADDGHIRWCKHALCSVILPHLPDEEMRTIPSFPDYSVTPYKAVWKTSNLSGRHGDRPFLVATQEVNGRDYVRLRDNKGRICNRAVHKLFAEAYPNLIEG